MTFLGNAVRRLRRPRHRAEPSAEAQEATQVQPTVEAEAPRPFRIERRPYCLADLDREGIRGCIQELDELAAEVGCVVFANDAPSDHVVVVFAGNGERFFMLAVARFIRAPVIYVQDPQSFWYQGSDLLPDIRTFSASFLVPEIGERKALLFGQSSGGYAAMVASSYLRGSTVIGGAPQTFSDGAAKAAFRFVGVRALDGPNGLIDLRDLFMNQVDDSAARMIVMAASEAENPVRAHYWMDYLHALRMIDVPNIAIFITDSHNHAVVHQRLNRFAELLERLAAALSAPRAEREQIVATWLHEVFQPPG